jgi:phytol kinase
MSDAHLLGAWASLLAGALCGALALRSLGLATTYVRDLLHIGAGLWVFGWSLWSSPVLPIGLVLLATAALASVPLASRHVAVVARFRDSVADQSERFTGLIVYAASFALFTCAGLLLAPFPAAAALLALSLGDGVGGAVGRRWGRHRYHTAFGKPKSLEGSAAVAFAAAAGVTAAATVYSVGLGPAGIIALAAVATTAEAVAPRSSDNALVPAAVWLAATLMTG